MEFVRRATGVPRRLGVLAGSFHPPTNAHLALARAAFDHVDEVVFTLPRRFPHKQFDLVPFDSRLRLVELATGSDPRFSVALTDGGLFREISDECRQVYPTGTELWFLCGRDAAERIVTWDYEEPTAVEEMLRQFGLLVAPRQGRYQPPADLEDRIRPLTIGEEHDEMSATEVRLRIQRGDGWEHLVPPETHALVRALYLNPPK